MIEDGVMAQEKTQTSVAMFNLGDRVKIRHSNGRIGRVIELRGPLGPGGIAIYRVLIGRKPRIHVEVRADQLDAFPKPKETSMDAPASAR